MQKKGSMHTPSHKPSPSPHSTDLNIYTDKQSSVKPSLPPSKNPSLSDKPLEMPINPDPQSQPQSSRTPKSHIQSNPEQTTIENPLPPLQATAEEQKEETFQEEIQVVSFQGTKEPEEKKSKAILKTIGKVHRKTLSRLEIALVELEETQNLRNWLDFLTIKDLVMLLSLNRFISKYFKRRIWERIFCKYYNVSSPNPLLSKEKLPGILKNSIVSKTTNLLENIQAQSKTIKGKVLIDKGTSNVATDRRFERVLLHWTYKLPAGDNEGPDLVIENRFLSYYPGEKRLVIWELERRSGSNKLLEMLHPIDDVLKDYCLEGDSYIILKFERQEIGKEPFLSIYYLDIRSLQEPEITSENIKFIKEYASLTVFITNLPTSALNSQSTKRKVLKDPSQEELKNLFHVEEKQEEKEVHFRSETYQCSFEGLKAFAKNNLACCIDYDCCIMLLADMERQDGFRIVPLRYSYPVLMTQTIELNENKDCLLVGSNQEIIELTVQKEEGKLKYESNRVKLKILFQNKMKILTLQEGLFILYDDEKWAICQVNKGIIGSQEIRNWFKKEERAKIGSLWVENKSTVCIRIDVVRYDKDWRGYFEQGIYKADMKVLQTGGKFKEVIRMKMKEEMMYRQRIVHTVDEKTVLMCYFVSVNILENKFVIEFWRNKGEVSEEKILGMERGVILKEYPEHKKLVWKESFEERKLIVNILGNGLASERFVYILDFDNVWDLIRYEGKHKPREIL